MEGERSIPLRRAVLFGVPFLYLALGLLHPTANPELGDTTGLFIGLHIAQLFLIGGLAYALWLLLEGLRSRAAAVARALILPFVIAYTALDAVLGIAWGLAADKANELPVADQAAAGRFIEAYSSPRYWAMSCISVRACSGLPSRSRPSRRSGVRPHGRHWCS